MGLRRKWGDVIGVRCVNEVGIIIWVGAGLEVSIAGSR